MKIITQRVCKLLRQYANQYCRFSLRIHRVNHRSGTRRNLIWRLLVIRTYSHCTNALTTTVQIIRRKAVTERESPDEKSIHLYSHTITNITNTWEILASVKAILTCFIPRYNCSGSCKIPAVMKLAENIIPNGNHRIKYGLLVYAGIIYAMINATV